MTAVLVIVIPFALLGAFVFSAFVWFKLAGLAGIFSKLFPQDDR